MAKKRSRPHKRKWSRHATWVRRGAVAALFFGAVRAFASGDDARPIAGARVELGEVVEALEEPARSIDLGPAPHPGQRRTFTLAQLEHQIRAAGFDPKDFTLPRLVVAEKAGRRVAAAELAQLATPHIRRALPAGVTLRAVTANHAVLISDDIEWGNVRVPKLPKRVGVVRTTFTAELLIDHTPYQQVPLTVFLQLDASAARHAAVRGAAVLLEIHTGNATVGARATALQSLDVGEEGTFRIVSTGRVLRARLVSANTAAVTGPQ